MTKWQKSPPVIRRRLKTLKRNQSAFKGIHDWCKTNRNELTNGGETKTANLTTGTVSWRLGTPSCSVSRDVEGVIEMLRRMGLERFIRTKEEVNKQAVWRSQMR